MLKLGFSNQHLTIFLTQSLVMNSGEENDIEDALKCKKSCVMASRAIGKVTSSDGDWFIPTSLNGLLQTLNQLPQGTTYRLVHGNTGRGDFLWKIRNFRTIIQYFPGVFDYGTKYGAYISLKNVAELVEYTKEPLTFGAGMSLSALIDLFDDVSVNLAYAYCKTLAAHIRKVAHPSVRNVGTVGGNLMLKHAYREFPSDVFLVLEASGATVVIKALDNKVTLFWLLCMEKFMQWLRVFASRQNKCTISMP